LGPLAGSTIRGQSVNPAPDVSRMDDGGRTLPDTANPARTTIWF